MAVAASIASQQQTAVGCPGHTHVPTGAVPVAGVVVGPAQVRAIRGANTRLSRQETIASCEGGDKVSSRQCECLGEEETGIELREREKIYNKSWHGRCACFREKRPTHAASWARDFNGG